MAPSDQEAPTLSGGKRAIMGFAIAWLVLAAVSLILAFAVAEGEARTHATGHLFLGFVAMALFVLIGLLWTPSRDGLPSLGRAALLIVTAMASFGQVLESIGASGYDRFNAGHEIELLTRIHNGVGVLGPVALMAIPIGLIAVVVLGIARLIGRVSAARAG
jgi:hypothetical protein